MIRRYFIIILMSLFFLSFQFMGYADFVYLKNGDRVSGKVLEEKTDQVMLQTESMGVLHVERVSVEKIVLENNAKEVKGKNSAEVAWKREISLGYNTSRGNTETGEIAGNFIINRKHKHVNETTLKGDLFYSEANKKTDAFKLYGMGRYAFSFGTDKKWYNFYRVEVDHDRFANIYYRVLPATGLGYWVFTHEDMKLLLEAGIGWEHTKYRHDAKNNDEAVLVPRLYFEKRFYGKVLISEDFYWYPALGAFGDYRFRSETAVTAEFNSMFAIRFSVIDDYNSQPKDEKTKKNDLQLVLISCVFLLNISRIRLELSVVKEDQILILNVWKKMYSWIRSVKFILCIPLILTGCSSYSRTADLDALYTKTASEYTIKQNYDKPQRNPVIVIPGLLGSELMDSETGTVVWGAFSGTPNTKKGAQLAALPMKEGVSLKNLRDNVVFWTELWRD